MIKVINILLALLCLALGYFLFKSINNPVKYQAQIEKRNKAVQTKLYEIRDAQEAFKAMNGHFATDFDTLQQVMRTGKYTVRNIVSGDSVTVNILDSLFDGNVSKIDSLAFVPYGNGAKFDIDAGVFPNPSDSTEYIDVFEASTMNDVYLGGENGVNQDYWKAGKKVKIGSMTAPILNGNWE